MTSPENNTTASATTRNGSCNSAAPPPRIDPKSWNYDDHDGECGPCAWRKPAKPQFQSPIALHTAVASNGKQGVAECLCLAKGDTIKFVNYDKPIGGVLFNTGRSIQFTPEGDPETMPTIEGGHLEQPFRFVQYHYHWAQKDGEGSEHTLNGRYFPVELHLVHQGVRDPSKLAVLSVLLEAGTDGTVLKAEESVLNAIKDYEKSTKLKPQRLDAKLPKNTSAFVRYQGSLTTPPCSENVIWTVFIEPLHITKEQLSSLRGIHDCHGKLIERNYRKLQSDNGRKVLYMKCE